MAAYERGHAFATSRSVHLIHASQISPQSYNVAGQCRMRLHSMSTTYAVKVGTSSERPQVRNYYNKPNRIASQLTQMLPDSGGMRLPPASVVASWPAPKYTDPEVRGNALLIVNVIFQGLATIAVAGRLYSRYIKQWFGIDDALIIMAYVSCRSFEKQPELAANEG